MVNVSAANIDQKFAALETRMETIELRFTAIDASLSELKGNSDAKFQALMEAVTALHGNMAESSHQSPPMVPLIHPVQPPLAMEHIPPIVPPAEFFEVNQTPEEMKVRIAAVHFGAKPSEWYQGFLEERGMVRPPWNELVQKLQVRFQGNILTIHVIALKNLKQVAGVEEYNDTFEMLKNRCCMPKEVLLDHYLGGLKEEIVHGISLVEISSMSHAMKLAKVQENLLNSTIYRKNVIYNNKTLTPFTHNTPQPNSVPSPSAKFLPNVPHNPRTQQGSSYKSSPISYMNSNQSTNRRPVGNTSNQSYQSNLAIRKPPLTMTKVEMEEERRKELCFYCKADLVKDIGVGMVKA
ncbi:Retrotransposon gag protein [Quillaja saponaria]|uniref:Retrotransposon gag protein n=1 Tax=Quillaja saponaria TaxID=32244 RepID=A0AAD7VHF2_QUISA|nr:Retrotransposon gag protein [Quillaja saponaria]